MVDQVLAFATAIFVHKSELLMDESPRAEKAIPLAADLARAADSTVILARVIFSQANTRGLLPESVMRL